MQNLRKNCSLDCQAGGGTEQRSLAHSVSIVVELAKEASQLGGGGGQSVDSARESFESDSGSAEKTPSLSQRGDEEAEEAEEDEEEDPEAEACLSSELARRVVLVDEAEGIFIRNRAQSAEPGALSACCRRFAAAQQTTIAGQQQQQQIDFLELKQQRSESTSPPVQQLRHQNKPHARYSLSGQKQFQLGLLAGSGCGGGSGSGSGVGPVQFAAGGCELAERGALSRLGMRRNTHHHQHHHHYHHSLYDQAGQVTPSTLGCSRQQSPIGLSPNFVANNDDDDHDDDDKSDRSESRKDNLLATFDINNNSRQQQQQQQQFLKQHRRQSLQISLLTGAHCCYKDSSRSLTEEELRGEREFNEQVRSAAKSPENTFTTSQQQTTLTSSATLEQAPASSSHHSHSPTTSSLATGLHDQHRQKQKQKHQQQINRLRSSSNEPHIIGSRSPDPSSSSGAAGSKSAENRNISRTSAQDLALLAASSPSSRRSSLLVTSSTSQLGKQSSPRSRRVSFGSIDPIILNPNRPEREQAGANSSLLSLRTGERASRQQRASICGPALLACTKPQTPANDPIATTTSGILRKLERASYSTSINQPHQQQALSLVQSDPLAKRHSLALASAITTMSGHEQENQSGDISGQQAATMSDQRGHDNDSPTTTTTTSISGPNPEPLAGARRTRFASVAGESAGDISVVKPSSSSGAAAIDRHASSGKLDEEQRKRDEAAMEKLVASQAARKHQSKSIGGERDAREASRVQSIMANARLRQEEFAKLLEEHEQIVNEINRFENKISTNASANKQLPGAT